MSRYLRMTSLALGAMVAAMVAAIVALLVAYTPAGAASDRLPDLGMLHPRIPLIENTSDGRTLLRFTSIVVNVGAGPFELHGQRPDSTTPEMTTTQRIFDDAGGFRDVSTPASIFWGGDGHNHWHVRDLLDYELQRLDNGVKVGTYGKIGFCFYDNFNYGSPDPAYYVPKTPTRSCLGGLSATRTQMGLSPGWGDRYGRMLVGQYIDITGLTPGRYRLIGTADANDWFLESDNANNVAWVDIQLTQDSVRIVSRGPSAPPYTASPPATAP